MPVEAVLEFGGLVLVLVVVLVLIVGPKLFIEPGSKAFFSAFERERPRIVNNFAASASPDYEFSFSSEKMN